MPTSWKIDEELLSLQCPRTEVFLVKIFLGWGGGGGGLNGKGDRALIDLLRLVSFSQHFLLLWRIASTFCCSLLTIRPTEISCRLISQQFCLLWPIVSCLFNIDSRSNNRERELTRIKLWLEFDRHPTEFEQVQIFIKVDLIDNRWETLVWLVRVSPLQLLSNLVLRPLIEVILTAIRLLQPTIWASANHYTLSTPRRQSHMLLFGETLRWSSSYCLCL